MNGVGVLFDEIKINMMHASKQRCSLSLGGGNGVEVETKTKIYRSNFPNCDDEEY
jgi:hypothetical protein